MQFAFVTSPQRTTWEWMREVWQRADALELGIGAGWNEEECDAFGIELGSMRERLDRFEEGLEVLESLLNNDRTRFRGDYCVIADAMNNPKPVQRPLPICIGGRGEQRTIPLAAR